MLRKKGVLEIVGAARVDREEFPEPLSAIKETIGQRSCRTKMSHADLQPERL